MYKLKEIVTFFDRSVLDVEEQWGKIWITFCGIVMTT